MKQMEKNKAEAVKAAEKAKETEKKEEVRPAFF